MFMKFMPRLRNIDKPHRSIIIRLMAIFESELICHWSEISFSTVKRNCFWKKLDFSFFMWEQEVQLCIILNDSFGKNRIFHVSETIFIFLSSWPLLIVVGGDISELLSWLRFAYYRDVNPWPKCDIIGFFDKGW